MPEELRRPSPPRPHPAGPSNLRWALAITLALVAACGPRATRTEPEAEPPPTPPPDTAAARDTLPEPPVSPDTLVSPVGPDSTPTITDSLRLEAPAADSAAPRVVRICAGGDVLVGNNLDTRWAERASARLGWPVDPFPDPDSILEPLRSLIADPDLLLLNVEGAIGEGTAPSKCRPGSTRCYAFRQPIAVAAALRRLAATGQVVGNLANNHALDAGIEGLHATIDHLRAADVHVVGTDTIATPVALTSGDTVATLGFSVFRAGPDARDLDAVRRHVARAADRFPLVIVTMHMGAEGRDAQRTPNREETFLGENRGNSVAFARTAIAAGASLVVGHGPHVLRAMEWAGESLIIYSLGNLVTYGPFNLGEPLNRGAIACASLSIDGGLLDAELLPTEQAPPGHVSPDSTRRGISLVDSLSRLDFPHTGVRITPEGRIERRTPSAPPAGPDPGQRGLARPAAGARKPRKNSASR